MNRGGCVWGSVLQIHVFEMSEVHVDMVQGSIGVATRGRTSHDAGRKSLRSGAFNVAAPTTTNAQHTRPSSILPI
jgi:hypothetical protein